MHDYLRTAPALLLVITGACAGQGQGERVRDARIAQIDARAEANKEAIDDRQEARTDQIEQRHDRREAAVEATDRPGEDAAETLVGISEERAQYASQARARLSKIALRINAAQEKIAVLGAHAPTPLKTELETSAKQYDQIKADVMKLNETPPSNWNSTKQDIDTKTEKLDDRVEQLSEAIDDV